MQEKKFQKLYQENNTYKADIDYINSLLGYIQGVVNAGKDTFDLEKQYAVAASFAQLGELLNPAYGWNQGLLPGIPHQALYDMRNGLIHYHEHVKSDDVWNFAASITPLLSNTIQKITSGKEEEIGKYDASKLESEIDKTDLFKSVCENKVVTIEQKGNTKTKKHSGPKGTYREGPKGREAEPNLQGMHRALTDIRTMTQNVAENDFLNNPAFETKRKAVEWAVTLLGECAVNVYSIQSFSQKNPLRHTYQGVENKPKATATLTAKQNKVEYNWMDLGALRHESAHAFGIQGASLWACVTKCQPIQNRVEDIMGRNNYLIPGQEVVAEEKQFNLDEAFPDLGFPSLVSTTKKSTTKNVTPMAPTIVVAQTPVVESKETKTDEVVATTTTSPSKEETTSVVGNNVEPIENPGNVGFVPSTPTPPTPKGINITLNPSDKVFVPGIGMVNKSIVQQPITVAPVLEDNQKPTTPYPPQPNVGYGQPPMPYPSQPNVGYGQPPMPYPPMPNGYGQPPMPYTPMPNGYGQPPMSYQQQYFLQQQYLQQQYMMQQYMMHQTGMVGPNGVIFYAPTVNYAPVINNYGVNIVVPPSQPSFAQQYAPTQGNNYLQNIIAKGSSTSTQTEKVSQTSKTDDKNLSLQ